MDVALEVLPSLLNGLKTTILLFLITLLLTIPLGFIVSLIRVYAPRFVSMLVQVYVYIMRGTPLLLQLMFVFFGLPLIGITFGRFPAAVFTFVLNYTAYFSELFRGGILSVPVGQFEAITVLNIGKTRGFRRIILPQIFRVILPSVGNEVISLVKDTSLIYILGIGELLRAGQIAANSYASLIPFLVVGVIYMGLTGIVTFFLNKIEKKLYY